MKNSQQEVSSQTLKFSIINYIGAAIGVISTLFIYPDNKEFLGMVRYIFDGAQILTAFFVFGTSQSLINYFPRFKESEEKRNVFFSTTLLIVLVNSILFSIIFLLLANVFTNHFPDFHAFDYLEYSLVMAFSFAFMDVCKRHASNYKKIAFPTILERFLVKIFLPIIFLLILGDIIGMKTGRILYTFCFGILFIIALLYVFRIAKIKFNLNYKSVFTKGFKKEYTKYSVYAFFSIFGAFLAFKIDGIMVPNLIEASSAMSANGSYSIGVVLAATLAIPAIGMYTIYSPIIADFLAKNQLNSLGEKYKEVSMILFAIGGVLMSCICLGITDLFSILPTKENLQDTIPIILILGTNVVIDMSTGFNSHILMYSKYYRFNIVAIAILTLLNISLNIYFIKYLGMGIEGAAYATLISMTLYNSVKLVFIYVKFKIQPFTVKHFLLLVVFAVIILLFKHVIPSTGNTILDLILRIGSCLSISGIVIYKLRMIPMLNDWITKKMG